LKSPKPESGLFVERGDELSLSNPALLQLLCAVLDAGKPFRFEAKGGSMSPFIRNGDIITVSPVRFPDLVLGDVTAIKHASNERLIVHRIVGKLQNSLIIKGDNLPSNDGPIFPDRVLGRVCKIERKGKNIRLGLGLERVIIALLSRAGLLPTLLYPIRKIKFASSQVRKFTGSVPG
jgi:signal peptidase I